MQYHTTRKDSYGSVGDLFFIRFKSFIRNAIREDSLYNSSVNRGIALVSQREKGFSLANKKSAHKIIGKKKRSTLNKTFETLLNRTVLPFVAA